MKSIWKKAQTPQGGAILAAVVSLLVLLPVWFWLGAWYQGDLVRQARTKVTGEISARANALTSAINQRIALLQGLYAFTRTEWPDTQFDQPFEVYSAGVFFNSTGVRTLMIAPEGIARYIFPIADSPALSGYDILNDPDPDTRADVQRAIHTRAIALSRPGTLRQGGFGVTAWEAVYRGSDLWGLVSIAVDMNAILADAGVSNPASGLDVALQDGSGSTFFGPPAIWQADPVIQKIITPDGTWELGGAPEGGWDGVVRSEADVFRLVSLVSLGLIIGMVYLTVNRQGRLTQAVALRTRQIAQAQQELETRVDERTRQLSTLLTISRQIGSTLALAPLLDQILIEMKKVLDYSAAGILQVTEAGDFNLVNQAGELPARQGLLPVSIVDEAGVRRVISTLQPVTEPHWQPADLSGVELSWMGVPLLVKDRAMGVLILVQQGADRFTPENANLALAFAQQVAIAIENATLYEQAGQLAVLEERQRLARELHDSVSQVLYSIGLGARTAQAALDHNPAQIADAIDYVNRLAEAGQVEMRALIFELRPESLQVEGLVKALEKQAAVLRKRHQLEVKETLCAEPPAPLAVKEALYRISQEATHNIVKHAHATQVIMSLSSFENELCLEIEDDGAGFDPSAALPGHFGLQTMRERASQIKASIQIESCCGQGTKIKVKVGTQLPVDSVSNQGHAPVVQPRPSNTNN